MERFRPRGGAAPTLPDIDRGCGPLVPRGFLNALPRGDVHRVSSRGFEPHGHPGNRRRWRVAPRSLRRGRVEKERLILKEVRRVLRPGGFIYVVSPNVHQPDARNDPDHINLFAPRELAAEARRAGYRHVDLGTNFWRQFCEPPLHLGKFGNLISGALWKMAPIDRFAGSASVIAWK